MDYEYIQDSTKTTDISIDDFVRRVSLSVWTNKKKNDKVFQKPKKKRAISRAGEAIKDNSRQWRL